MSDEAQTDVAASGKAMPAYRGVYRTASVPSCVLDKEDLVRLFEDLELKGREGLNHHLASLERPKEQSSEEWERLKEQARSAYRLSMLIYGAGGEQVALSSAEALTAQRLPDKVTQVLFDSAYELKTVLNFEPNNRFRVNLDFTEPPGFNKYEPHNAPTPNASALEVNGANATWVTGVYEHLMAYFKSRGTKRGWLHSAGAYNLYYWFVAIPGSLWVVYRIGERFAWFFNNLHGALVGAIYIYIFLLAFLVARIVVGGLRWIFPLVEMRGSRSTKTRGFVGAILAAIVLGLVGDVLWAFLT